MKELTKEELMKIFNEGKNLTDKPIYIDFYADWWGPCRMFKQVLEEVIPEYKDKIDFYKVESETEPVLAQGLGILNYYDLPNRYDISWPPQLSVNSQLYLEREKGFLKILIDL